MFNIVAGTVLVYVLVKSLSKTFRPVRVGHVSGAAHEFFHYPLHGCQVDHTTHNINELSVACGESLGLKEIDHDPGHAGTPELELVIIQ